MYKKIFVKNCKTGLLLFTGDTHYSNLIYWLVVAVICAFIAYGRFVLNPVH